MKVKCIDLGSDAQDLTIGNIYDVIRQEEEGVFIRDDVNYVNVLYINEFEEVVE